MKRKIHVRNKFTAYHNWPSAPDEVLFLREVHRHIFHVTATLPVTHDDRQLEFFMVQRDMNNFVDRHYADKILRGKSCEMMAAEILSFLLMKYDLKEGAVMVEEDGENGATVEI